MYVCNTLYDGTIDGANGRRGKKRRSKRMNKGCITCPSIKLHKLSTPVSLVTIKRDTHQVKQVHT